MGNAWGPLHRHLLVRRRSCSALWAAVLPMGTAATAGTASLLAILLAVLSMLAAAAERGQPPDDGVGWVEMHSFLPASATLPQAVAKIRRARIVTSELVGYSGSRSPVYDAYLRLGRLASDEQLGALVADTEPAMRVYAFHALTDRQSDAVVYGVLLSHLDDNARVRTLYGCIGDESTVFDAMLEHVEHRLSPAQLTEVRDLRERMKRATPARPAAGFLGRGR
jgi:hypothetical protein